MVSATRRDSGRKLARQMADVVCVNHISINKEKLVVGAVVSTSVEATADIAHVGQNFLAHVNSINLRITFFPFVWQLKPVGYRRSVKCESYRNLGREVGHVLGDASRECPVR